jgi:superfamily II DNA or RNA helicase
VGKRKTQSKKQTASKKATKPKKKVSAKKQFTAMSGFFPKSHSEKVEKDLTSFFAKIAVKKKKPKKKKITRKGVIKRYQKFQADIVDYEADRDRQFEFRFSQRGGSDTAYKQWVRGLPNSKEYPKIRSIWWDSWDKYAKKDPVTGELKIDTEEDGGDGRLAKYAFRRRDYHKALKESPKLEKKFKEKWNASLSEEAMVIDVTGLSAEEIAAEHADLGIFSEQVQNQKGEWIEKTDIFNYQPSAKPIYKEPVLIELAKSDDYGDVNLRHDSESNQAIFGHSWMRTSDFNAFVDVIRENNLSYDTRARRASMKYDDKKVAMVVQQLRNKGMTVELYPSVIPPKPEILEMPTGDERFDIFLDVDRSSFKVKVTGRDAPAFLSQLENNTSEEMLADDKIAFLKEHDEAKITIAEYKKSLKLKGEKLEKKVDKFALEKLSHYLPSDKVWRFVNVKEQTIPLGFVYHHVLAVDLEGKPIYNYNMKITDNRRLYLDKKVPIEALAIDPVTKDVFELRDYQASAVESAIDKKSGIVEAATGSGKTEIGAFIIAGHGLDAVWFSHREELINQAEKRMERRLGIDVGSYSGGKKEIIDTPGVDVNVMTVQSASEIMRTPRADYLREIMKLQQKLDRVNTEISQEQNEQKRRLLVVKRDGSTGIQSKLSQVKLKLQVRDYVSHATVQVFDESHHLTSLQFGDIARATPQSRYRYGLSATPYGNSTTDQRRIEALMGKSVSQITATQLINQGHLAKPNIIMVEIPHMVESLYPLYVYYETEESAKKKGKKKGDLKKIAHKDEDLTFAELHKAAIVRNNQFNDYVADFTVDSRKAGLNTMILVQQVEHGKLVQSKLEERGLRADFLTASGKESSEQKVILDRFKAGETDTLVATFGKAGEGVDIPGLDVIIKADGYKALVPTLQSVGRAMRIPKDSTKTECLIIDFDRKEEHYHHKKGSDDPHIEARLKHYSLERAFDVKRHVPIDEVDDEIDRVARINKTKQRKAQVPVHILEREERFLTRAQIRERREIEETASRMERFGTAEKQFTGRLRVSENAKRIAKDIPRFKDRRITAIEIQHLINNLEARGIDWQYIDFNARLDTSLEVEEAKSILQESEF